jgi:D-lactate dehydrogenase (cytochrome)
MLRDESNLAAPELARVYFPESADDVAAAVREAAGLGEPVTVSAGRTGIVGGAVPADSRWVISLSRMNRLLAAEAGESGGPFARVEAGMTLAALAEELLARDFGGARWHYPVDPTEPTAQVGGTIATDASGARSFRYGPTRAWVRALRVVLADGRLVSVRREQVRAEGGVLRWPEAFGERSLQFPEIARPACKCVAGYHLAPDVDLVDILVGSEGTLAVIAEAELALAAEPGNVLALVCFLPQAMAGPQGGLGLMARLKGDERLKPLSLEYFDGAALDLLRDERESAGEGGGGKEIPELPADAGAAVFFEQPYADDGELESCVEAIDEDLAAFGVSLDDTWAGDEPSERERMRALRHGLPEALNARIARLKREEPSLHKVGTDLAVPDDAFGEMVGAYRDALADCGMEHAVFGHAGENHLHVNLIPRTREELERAKALHAELARKAVALGGAVTAEHGIGRLKRELLEIQYGREGVAALRRVKDFFDPEGILNPGVLFPAACPGSTSRS